MSDVLIACDDQGRIEETNAALQQLVGCSDADLRGRAAIIELMHDPSGAPTPCRRCWPRPVAAARALPPNWCCGRPTASR